MFGLGRLRELLFRPVNVVDYGRVNLLNEERFKLKAVPTLGDDASARRLRAVYRISDLALAERGRSLITPIPGYSTRCMPMWAAPGVDWERVAREYV